MSVKIFVLLWLTATSGVVQEQPPKAPKFSDSARYEQARELVRMFVEREFSAFIEQAGDRLKASLSEDLVSTSHGQIGMQLGTYVRESEARITRGADDMDAVAMKLEYERGFMYLRIMLDSQARMAGFTVLKTEPKTTYSPPAYVDITKFREGAVEVKGDPKFPLSGRLTLPRSAGPHPVVILVHGSGPQDADSTIGGVNKPFRDLAWGLASRGIAVIRYDKRTKAWPQAHGPADWNLDRVVIQDALAAVNVARDTQQLDPKKIFVLGHSTGGAACPAILKRDPAIAGGILMAAPARPLLDLVVDQVEYLMAYDRTITEDERNRIDDVKKTIVQIRDPKTFKAEATFMGATYLILWEP